jgi:NAD-dependent dihydropyrimidine dehydrogenase PreA subunit
MGKTIVFCRCGGERIDPERLQWIENSLKESAAEVVVLSDLCMLSVLGKDKLKGLFQEGKEYMVIGCYERSMKLLLDKGNVDLENKPVENLNFLELSNEEIAQKVASFCENSQRVHSFNEITLQTDWKSWFPVIDYARCTSCGQCHDFCLFGVYEKKDGKVLVVNPQACKNNCPACGRICPQTAIIFPKYQYDGGIGGAEIADEEAEHQRQSADVKTILAGDIYQALEQRKNKRQSIIRNEAMRKAIEDRDKALNIFKLP